MKLTPGNLLFLHKLSLDVKDWVFIAGASWNHRKLQFQRLFPLPLPQQEKQFDNRVAPRLSVMKKFKNINIYSTISQGIFTSYNRRITANRWSH
jgi:hypothetical protein